MGEKKGQKKHAVEVDKKDQSMKKHAVVDKAMDMTKALPDLVSFEEALGRIKEGDWMGRTVYVGKGPKETTGNPGIAEVFVVQGDDIEKLINNVASQAAKCDGKFYREV